jgi:hypothetical protein
MERNKKTWAQGLRREYFWGVGDCEEKYWGVVKMGTGWTHARYLPSPYLWKERVVNTNGKNERTQRCADLAISVFRSRTRLFSSMQTWRLLYPLPASRLLYRP